MLRESLLVPDGLRIVATTVIAVALRWVLVRLIKRTVRTMAERTGPKARPDGTARPTGQRAARQQQRLTTLGALLISAATATIGLIAVLTIMAILGIPLAPLLASAGVGGVALGVGAQSLVRDFLSGIFMIIEDQFGVGDVIDTGETVGTVIDVSLRVTTLRDESGVTWYVRNGEIVKVGNRSQFQNRSSTRSHNVASSETANLADEDRKLGTKGQPT